MTSLKMSNEHSIVAPSSLNRIVPCPGSVAAQLQAPPEGPQPKAEAGRVAHEVAEQVLRDAIEGVPSPTCPSIDENINHAWSYANKLRDLGLLRSKKYGVEDRIEMPNLNVQMFGRTDYWEYQSKNWGRLYVLDYKSGWGIVEPYEHYPLIAYAKGLIDQLDLCPECEVSLGIYQPNPHHRAGPMRIWKTTHERLAPYFRKIQTAAAAALGDFAEVQAGPHCKYCRARYGCPGLDVSTLFAADYVQQPFVSDLPDGALGIELAILRSASQLVKDRLAALEELAIARIQRGQRLPGWTVGRTNGGLKWARPHEEVIAAAKLEGKDVTKPVLITPLQAKAFGLKMETINTLAARGPGKIVLEQDDLSEARRIFG